jgi:hypothetical protein
MISCAAGAIYAQNEPILVPDVVDYEKLVPIFDAPRLGQPINRRIDRDVGGFRITNVHRDYHKGEGDKAPTRDQHPSIQWRIGLRGATTAAWNNNSETNEGYSKSVTVRQSRF